MPCLHFSGLPRTGTNSFCAALEILLNGPAYHVGVQSALSDDKSHVLTWIDALDSRPYQSEEQKRKVLSQIKDRLDGYVATADPPLSQLVPELMEIYPNAKVICTVRDRETWTDSMVLTAKLARPNVFRFIFFWKYNNCRYLPRLWSLLYVIFMERYGTPATTKEEAVLTWERHHAWLEEIVPKDKLFYVSVKDGWEPLCKALDMPIPKDVPFPRLNDSKSFEAIFRNWAIQGLTRWAVVSGVMIAFIAATIAYRNGVKG